MSDAITVASDMKIYEAEFNAGLYERLALNTNLFNAASRGGLMLITQVHRGNYLKNAYFKQISSLVTRQDITSVSAVDSKKLEQVEEAAVKLHSKIGPVQTTLKAWAMAGLETPEGSMMLGELVGDAVAKRMADQAIIAANAAVAGQTALVHDITAESTKTANMLSLVEARGKWGDQMNKLAAWVLHSKPQIDLIKDGLDNYKVENIAGTLVMSGQIETAIGGPMIVSDNSNLKNSGSPNTYNVLGVAPMGVLVRQSELQTIVVKTVTGLEQLAVEIQGEFAITVGVDGFTWDITNGGANPSDADLGTSDYWDKVRTDTTGLPLVKLLCQ